MNSNVLIQHGSQSEDESFNEHVDSESLYNETQDDDDDFCSSSELELITSPNEERGFLAIDNDNIQSTYNLELTDRCESTSNHNKRSSGRHRKEGKVPMHTKNQFPGRPRIGRRTFVKVSNVISTKSPVCNQETETTTLNPEISVISNETESNKEIPLSDAVATSFNDSKNDKKISPGKRKINYPGKKTKLGGRRKTMEYRRKRGPKGKYKNFSIPIQTTALNANPEKLAKNDDDKPDNETIIENRIILCSSKDSFVLSQDICLTCGSLGKGEEGRLIVCARCGQCYHPYCTGIKKINKVMLGKGWGCLDCTVCEYCGKPTDEGRLLLCDECDLSYHTYCLDPPLEEVPCGPWKCQSCVFCVKCNSKSPGYRSQWQENYTLCSPCASQVKCPVCKQNYEENDLIIECIQCKR